MRFPALCKHSLEQNFHLSPSCMGLLQISQLRLLRSGSGISYSSISQSSRLVGGLRLFCVPFSRHFSEQYFCCLFPGIGILQAAHVWMMRSLLMPGFLFIFRCPSSLSMVHSRDRARFSLSTLRSLPFFLHSSEQYFLRLSPTKGSSQTSQVDLIRTSSPAGIPRMSFGSFLTHPGFCSRWYVILHCTPQNQSVNSRPICAPHWRQMPFTRRGLSVESSTLSGSVTTDDVLNPGVVMPLPTLLLKSHPFMRRRLSVWRS